MKKREFTAEYKAKIVVEVLKEEKMVSEIASREGINRTQLQKWKKEFIENAARVFSQSKVEKVAQKELGQAKDLEDNLMKKVGQLTIEVDWLKKKSGQLLGSDWETKSGFKG